MAKLGTHERPAILRVQTIEEAEEATAYAQERGWIVIVGVEPDQPEDISDLRRLMKTEPKPKATPHVPKVSGNDYCPCRSGKKFKKCCGAAASSAGA